MKQLPAESVLAKLSLSNANELPVQSADVGLSRKLEPRTRTVEPALDLSPTSLLEKTTSITFNWLPSLATIPVSVLSVTTESEMVNDPALTVIPRVLPTIEEWSMASVLVPVAPLSPKMIPSGLPWIRELVIVTFAFEPDSIIIPAVKHPLRIGVIVQRKI